MCLEVNRREAVKKKKKRNPRTRCRSLLLHLIVHVFGVFLRGHALIVLQEILWIWLGGDIALIRLRRERERNEKLTQKETLHRVCSAKIWRARCNALCQQLLLLIRKRRHADERGRAITQTCCVQNTRFEQV